MALKLPQLKLFSGVDAKSRMFILFAAVVGISLAIYMLVRVLGGEATVTTARVAGAPKNLVSTPGGEINSPEYERVLREANARRLETAKGAGVGASAVPTVINVESAETGCIMCPSPDSPNVADDIDALMNAGKLSKENADILKEMAKKNVSPEEYAEFLDSLVKSGKLSPEEARLLLEKYKKQHANALLSESGRTMDALIKSGQLPLSVANELLELQKRKLTPTEYAAELARLVKEGKISPQTAAALLAQYTQQFGKEAAKKNDFLLRQMVKAGQVTPDVAKTLEEMQKNNIPLDEYAAAINKLVTEGKITPAVAAKLIEQYRAAKIANTGPIAALAAKGRAGAELAERLLKLQANNASAQSYADELKRGIQAGVITANEATALMQQYQASIAPISGIVPSVEGSVPTDAFKALQQRVQAGEVEAPPPEQFADVPQKAQNEALQERLKRIQQLQSAMQAQAQNLINTAWAPPSMSHTQGSGSSSEDKKSDGDGTEGPDAREKNGEAREKSTIKKPVLIKAGTIFFAVLDTAVNSDYPDTPVMATIIEGKFKNAKLLGKLTLVEGKNKVSLNFTLMDKDEWPSTKQISASAIDPDTARTVMASEVDNHYFTKYSAILATSFLQGYSSAITNEGTSTTGIFGTSTSHPSLSPGNKIAVGLGQIGTNLSAVAQKNVNLPATVKVNAGVGLGILFTAEVTE